MKEKFHNSKLSCIGLVPMGSSTMETFLAQKLEDTSYDIQGKNSFLAGLATIGSRSNGGGIFIQAIITTAFQLQLLGSSFKG